MERLSSTSSSSGRPLPGGFPWAFVCALVVVACVELGFRWMEPALVIPYRLGALEYSAVAGFLESYGPAEVSVIGSSRARQGILVPELSGLLEGELGRRVEVSNYGCAGARAGENHAIVDYMLKRERPGVLLYGMTCRQLLSRRGYHRGVAEFWGLPDWLEFYRDDPVAASSLLPMVVRAEIAGHWRTLRYRHRLGTLFHDAARAWELREVSEYSLGDILRGLPTPSPLRGELLLMYPLQPGRTLSNTPVSDKRLASYVDRLLEDGRYRLCDRQLDHVRGIIKSCRQRATGDALEVVLFEVPLPNILVEHLPEGTVERFRAMVREVASDFGVDFLTVDDYGLEFSGSDFSEQSHLSPEGARRLTKAVAELAVIPRLTKVGREVNRAADRMWLQTLTAAPGSHSLPPLPASIGDNCAQ